MSTEIQQLLLGALTDLTKEYQKQSNEQIEREKMLINALEQLQNDQSEQSEIYRNIQKNYIENLHRSQVLESQVNSLIEQNTQLLLQLNQLKNSMK